MGKYPIYLELDGRRVVVIGGGSVAARKLQVLMDAGARLVVVAKNISDQMMDACSGSNVELVRGKYSSEYLAGAVLVIAATDDQPLNEQIYKDCQRLEIICNVVDQPALCDFYVPAVVKRGSLQIAIGTDGKSPAFAGHLRKKLEQQFGEKHGEFLIEMEKIRKRVIAEVPDIRDRKVILGHLANDESFECFEQKGAESWRKRADSIIKG